MSNNNDPVVYSISELEDERIPSIWNEESSLYDATLDPISPFFDYDKFFS
jgi:hypothetical protein